MWQSVAGALLTLPNIHFSVPADSNIITNNKTEIALGNADPLSAMRRDWDCVRFANRSTQKKNRSQLASGFRLLGC
jgi:hypothetical protein